MVSWTGIGACVCCDVQSSLVSSRATAARDSRWSNCVCNLTSSLQHRSPLPWCQTRIGCHIDANQVGTTIPCVRDGRHLKKVRRLRHWRLRKCKRRDRAVGSWPVGSSECAAVRDTVFGRACTSVAGPGAAIVLGEICPKGLKRTKKSYPRRWNLRRRFFGRKGNVARILPVTFSNVNDQRGLKLTLLCFVMEIQVGGHFRVSEKLVPLCCVPSKLSTITQKHVLHFPCWLNLLLLLSTCAVCLRVCAPPSPRMCPAPLSLSVFSISSPSVSVSQQAERPSCSQRRVSTLSAKVTLSSLLNSRNSFSRKPHDAIILLFPSLPISVSDNLRPFFSTSSFSFFITFFLPFPPLLYFFLSLTIAVMSSTKTLNFKGGTIFVTSLNASCNTMRKRKQLHFCCHFPTSGALKASHQRINVGINAIGLSLVPFFGIKKNFVVQACCGHSPLCSIFTGNSTISPFVSFFQVQRNFRVESVTSHSCFCLVQSRCLFQVNFFQPR